MIRQLAPALLALLVAGCAVVPVPLGTAQPRPDPSWLAGIWLPVAPPEGEYPLSCNSGLPIRFDRDGGWMIWGEAGTWRIDGDRLIMVTTEDMGIHPDVKVGERTVQRIERVDGERMRLTLGRETTLFRRCPPA